MDVQGLCPLIEVFDMPASLAFYRDILGFSIVNQSGSGDDCGWVWLRLGSAELMLNTAYDVGERPEKPDAQRATGHRDVCFYFHCADLDAAHAYLTSKGVSARKPNTTWYGMRQMYFADPDGFGICFQHPVEKAGGN